MFLRSLDHENFQLNERSAILNHELREIQHRLKQDVVPEQAVLVDREEQLKSQLEEIKNEKERIDEQTVKIAEIARQLPDIKFWLPTREYSFVREWMQFAKVPKNLTIRLSAYMVDGKPPTQLAKKLGLTTSGVSPEGFNCPASEQGNECADCRACWDGSVDNINYKKH